MPPLELGPGDLRALAAAALDLVAHYYETLPSRPVMPDTAARDITALLCEPLPSTGTPAERLLEVVREVILPHSRHNGHPRFFGYIASPGHPVAALGDLIASTLNANVTAWRSAPAATELEHTVIGWIKEIAGFPPESCGLLLSGGSLANLAGLAAARAVKGRLGPDGLAAHAQRMRVYVSREGHFSIRKAAAILGIGEANVRTIETDSRLRMDLAHLEQCVREDIRDGHFPLCVVATAGSTGTGAIDPLAALAEFARAHDLWLHVDAAYGGFAALAPSVRPLLAGMELADSLSLDPHKWLYTSTGCGCILYRDPAAARRAFSGGAEYTRTLGVEDAEAFAFWDYGPELSRPFRALGIWLLLKFVGAAELGRAIEHNIACAQYLEKLVAASGDFEMLAPVSLSVFCFRYAPPGFTGSLDALNERILVRLQRDGGSYLSNARVGGRFALRGCVVNYRTAERDMEILLEDVRRAAAAVGPPAAMRE